MSARRTDRAVWVTGRARRLALTALLGLGLALPGGLAQTTSQKLEQLQKELQDQRQLSAQQKAQLERLRQNIASLSAQQRQTLSRLETLSAGVSTLENEVATLTARTALAERQLADTSAQLTLTQTRVERLQADVREILNTLYRGRSRSYLQLLSQSTSLSDLLIRLQYSNMSGEYNTKVIQTLRAEVQNLDAQRAQQAQQAQALKDVQAQRTAALTTLKARRSEANKLLATLRASEQGQRVLATQRQAEQALTARTIDQLVGQVVAERARLEEERRRRLEEERKRREEEARRIREAQERARQEAQRLARLRAEQERVAAQRAQQQREAALAAQRQREEQNRREQAALQTRQQQVQQEQTRVEQALQPLPASSGPLGFPLPGGAVSSGFGASGSPWVELAGGADAQAVAAQEGNVLASTYYASLGWVILVDHGSVTSIYIGLRDPLVSTGDHVVQGTPLGTVGGSNIIGPGRMAFQVRRGGAIVNPGF